MLERIDSRELNAWVAYERITGPIGPERADVQAALIAATVANTARSRRARRYAPKDFIPKWDDPKRWEPVEQTEFDHLSLIRSMNAAMGGREVSQDVNAGRPAGQGGGRRHRRRERVQGDNQNPR